jgi:hypothetical protein
MGSWASRRLGYGVEEPRPPRATQTCHAGDYEIVKVAAHLESTRLLDPVDLDRLEAGRSEQPPDFFAGAVVIGRGEEDRLRAHVHGPV